MRPDHAVLTSPLHVDHENGRLTVLKKAASKQSNMGEALTLDGVVNSIDAEVIAKGTSFKGPNRGAIVRHGRYTLWAFEGGVEDMTEAGQALFVNVVFYAARHADSPVLERMLNGTRDGPLAYLRPQLVATLKDAYLPREIGGKNLQQIRDWLRENRPYLRSKGAKYEVDEFAKNLGVANHKRAILERCIDALRKGKDIEKASATLARYTGQDLGASGDAWSRWYEENRPYLFFSDCEGFRFKVDEEARIKKMPVEQLRGWSSENVDYRVQD